jgi:hypothetical protein
MFDPSTHPINCTANCGATEYVKDVGNPNWMSVKARLENLEAGQNRPLSLEDTTWYVDKDTGSDDNPGTETEPWENLEKALDMLQSFTWVHNCAIKWRGAQTLAWDYVTLIRVENNKNIFIDAGDEVTVIEPVAVCDISAQIGGLWREVGNTLLALTPNEHKGKQLKLGNIGGVPGPLTGQKSTIIGNTVTTYRVAHEFSGDPAGYDFEVVVNASTLTVNSAPIISPDFFIQQTFGGIIQVSGRGNVYIQRTKFAGTTPVTAICKDKCRFFFSSCTFDKAQLTFPNVGLWRLAFIFCQGAHGALTDVRDPNDLTGATILPLDKCGIGSVGGDASVQFWDIFNEWSQGFFNFYGSFANAITENTSPGHAVRIDENSHVDQFDQGNAVLYLTGLIENASFGGFVIPFSGGLNSFAAVVNVAGFLTFGDNVDISGSVNGIYTRGGRTRLNGDVSGNNAIFGVTVIDNAAVYYLATANVTLTGPAGDISLDGLVAVPGGHNGIVTPAPNGTPVRDLVTGCVARVQPLFV